MNQTLSLLKSDGFQFLRGNVDNCNRLGMYDEYDRLRMVNTFASPFVPAFCTFSSATPTKLANQPFFWRNILNTHRFLEFLGQVLTRALWRHRHQKLPLQELSYILLQKSAAKPPCCQPS